jgi:hypothetical protein
MTHLTQVTRPNMKTAPSGHDNRGTEIMDLGYKTEPRGLCLPSTFADAGDVDIPDAGGMTPALGDCIALGGEFG